MLWLTQMVPLDGIITSRHGSPASFEPFLINVSWPAALDVTQEDCFTYTFTGLETLGT